MMSSKVSVLSTLDRKKLSDFGRNTRYKVQSPSSFTSIASAFTHPVVDSCRHKIMSARCRQCFELLEAKVGSALDACTAKISCTNEHKCMTAFDGACLVF